VLGKGIYKRRKETIERSFADLKELHGFRYARFRGLDKMKEQCLLTAAAYNIKKIANILGGYSGDFIDFLCNFNYNLVFYRFFKNHIFVVFILTNKNEYPQIFAGLT